MTSPNVNQNRDVLQTLVATQQSAGFSPYRRGFAFLSEATPNPTFLIRIPEFKSRGIDAPQWGQSCHLSPSSFVTRLRQIAQCWDVPAGFTLTTNRPALRLRRPRLCRSSLGRTSCSSARTALYGRTSLRNPAIPASAKLLFRAWWKSKRNINWLFKPVPVFLTKSVSANPRSLTGSGFDPGDPLVPKPTVCC